jgi:hypothetical protein
MTHNLVVTRPFLNFVRGDVIADVTKVTNILSNEYKKFVTKIVLPIRSKG